MPAINKLRIFRGPQRRHKWYHMLGPKETDEEHPYFLQQLKSIRNLRLTEVKYFNFRKRNEGYFLSPQTRKISLFLAICGVNFRTARLSLKVSNKVSF
jgi:hypothetical protein